MNYVVSVLLLFICTGTYAQTCSGGLGDPIVNITFGNGSGTAGPLAAGITNLVWQDGGCPGDGYYTIVSGTSACFGATWLTIGSDHTGDGYFMLINASYAPSDFYVQQIDGLCPGTSYQFAAWVMNIAARYDQIQPDITFRIEKTDGTLLQSYTTGDIQPNGVPKWVPFGFVFDTPPGISSVVIRMTNNAPGGIGNDLALDDITFRAAGPAIHTAVAGFSGNTVKLCEQDPQVLSIGATVEACYPTAVYQWQQSVDGGISWQDIPGAVTTSWPRPKTSPGVYLYRLSVAQVGNSGISACEVASQPVTVDVVATPAPSVSIEADAVSVCAGVPVNFIATPVNGGETPAYQWLVNRVATAAVGSTFADDGLKDGDVVSCVLTSNAVCVLDPMVGSNTLSPGIIPIPVTGVDVGASATKICADSVVVFTATPVNGGVSPSYEWMINGLTVATAGPVYTSGGLKDGDMVSCVMTGGLVCSRPVTAPEVIRMSVDPLPVIVLVPDTVIAGGSSMQLAPSVTGDILSYQWSPVTALSDPAVAGPVATPVINTAYTLEVKTLDGCRAVATEVVNVFYFVQLPGAFSPNGDGRNDVFRIPPSIPVVIHRLAVYNRWGDLLFMTANDREGWDGRFKGVLQPAGVYVWEVEYDNPQTRQVERGRGTVVLVR